jgi:hypothetical protein
VPLCSIAVVLWCLSSTNVAAVAVAAAAAAEQMGRSGYKDVDYVLTTRELGRLFRCTVATCSPVQLRTCLVGTIGVKLRV